MTTLRTTPYHSSFRSNPRSLDLTQISVVDFVAKYSLLDERNRQTIHNIEHVPGKEVAVWIQADGSWTLSMKNEIIDKDHEAHMQFFEYLGVCKDEAQRLELLSSKYFYIFVIAPKQDVGYRLKNCIVLKYIYNVEESKTTIEIKDGEIVMTCKTKIKYILQKDMVYCMAQGSQRIWDLIYAADDRSWQSLKNEGSRMFEDEDDINVYIKKLLYDSDLKKDFGMMPCVWCGWTMLNERTGEFAKVYHHHYTGPRN